MSFYSKNSSLGVQYLADFSELIIKSNLSHISNLRSTIDEFKDFYLWLDETVDF